MNDFRRYRVRRSSGSGWDVDDTETGKREHFTGEDEARTYAHRQEELAASLQSHWLKTR